jgi:FixJ family two-component response regulator
LYKPFTSCLQPLRRVTERPERQRGGDLNSDRPFIAVLDDEESVRQAIDRLLRAGGFAVECFASGEEFLASLLGRQPACLVLDLHMPGMDGFAVQDALAKLSRKLPVVVITGHDSPETRQRALDGGAAAYLCKPVGGRVLLDAVTTTLIGNTAGAGAARL